MLQVPRSYMFDTKPCWFGTFFIGDFFTGMLVHPLLEDARPALILGTLLAARPPSALLLGTFLTARRLWPRPRSASASSLLLGELPWWATHPYLISYASLRTGIWSQWRRRSRWEVGNRRGTCTATVGVTGNSRNPCEGRPRDGRHDGRMAPWRWSATVRAEWSGTVDRPLQADVAMGVYGEHARRAVWARRATRWRPPWRVDGATEALRHMVESADDEVDAAATAVWWGADSEWVRSGEIVPWVPGPPVRRPSEDASGRARIGRTSLPNQYRKNKGWY
jgi:hypothetical protein